MNRMLCLYINALSLICYIGLLALMPQFYRRHVSILSVLGISCTSILLVSVLGAVVDDPSRHRLPVQVGIFLRSIA